MILLLYDYRTRYVGINQIQNTYYPALELDTNEFYGEEIQNALNCFNEWIRKQMV